MAVRDRQNVLKDLTVKEAMRRLIIHLPGDATLEKAISYAIKYKVNAILVTDADQEALGVVTKTDLMGAYYAGLPLDTPAASIMVGPPLFCHLEDSLDAALDQMRTHKIHRLYVREEGHQAVGVLAYPDIVGLLYRYCHQCDRNLMRKMADMETMADRFRIREVMTQGVYAHPETDSLLQVMEGLASHRFGALLITGEDGAPVGVISKTDLILAYKHRIPPDVQAGTVMTRGVQACDCDDILVNALRRMIFSDVSRLFVYQESPRHIVGVFSLSDAARFRSGTCRACVSSRIRPQ
ncbi:MAG: cyclic nucleotide-binding/CBS domain-containing protein [Thermodesulfobacteriota bacterium]